MTLTIRDMTADDAVSVLAIYRQGIETGNATFETNVPDWSRWDATHIDSCRLVAQDDTGQICGWAALSPVSGRCVYGGVAEVSIYLATAARRQGIGTQLMQALITASEAAGYWTLQAVMFPENIASIALHQKHGFRVVGRRERIGQHHGVWRDTLMLERRSPVVGTS